MVLKYLIKLAALHKWHDEVESRRRLKQVLHTDQERVIAGEEDIFLEHSVLHLVILDQHILPYHLNRVEILSTRQLSQVDLAKSTPA